MDATVVSVQPNVTKQGRSSAYVVHIFTYQPDNDPQYGAKPPTTRDVFAEDRNHPQVAGQVLALQPGMRVKLDFQPQQNNPRYKDLVSVTVLQAAGQQSTYHQDGAQNQGYQNPNQTSSQGQPQQQQPAASKKDYVAERDAKDAARQSSIQRQTCLKAGVEIVKTLLERDGYYTKKLKQELIVDEVKFFADEFEAYLLGIKETFDPEQPVGDAGFPEPLYNDDDEIPF